MNRLKIILSLMLSAAALAFPSGGSRSFAQNERVAPQQAWTLDEALAEMRLHPQDAYLQYVALQLSRRAGRFEEAARAVQQLLPGDFSARAGRRDSADLFSIFNGALAVQESLQLDTMRFAVNGSRRPASESDADATKPLIVEPPRTPAARGRSAPQSQSRTSGTVQVSGLVGPTVKSHPWERMLGGRKAEVSALSRSVPEDFYFVEFRSLNKLLEAFDAGDLWGTHLFNQALREARTLDVGERLKRQLAIETEPALRPFYDLVVEEVAAVGSDPFVREGSDVTLLFRVKQPLVFNARMSGFLDNAERAHPSARRTTGRHLGVEYVQLSTPERDVSVYAAEPEPGLHVRGNSLAAFRRVLEAVKGKTEAGRPVRRLGESAEFRYIRTLMPRAEAEEDGFVYLSDPFIRRLVGPELKLTERRRMLCYNHLRMTGHAALLYRTEQGRWPASLEELRRADAAPLNFGTGELSCPDGGHYALSTDGTTGVCSRHGHALHMTPNFEIPVERVGVEEADEYRAFVTEYNSYWRTFFDPIALRLKLTPGQYRVETIILPLIDDSIYTALASALGGKPEQLDSLPVPARNIFSVGLRLNKEALLKSFPKEMREVEDEVFRGMGVPPGVAAGANSRQFLSEGIGNQIGFHVYDARPAFDLNMSGLLGMLFSGTTARSSGFSLGSFELLALTGLASLNSPVYISIPVRDEQVVDGFLERTDAAWAALSRQSRRGGFGFDLEEDFFKFNLPTGETARGFGLRFGPAKLRFFWARIGGGLYIASKPFILEDLAVMHAAAKTEGRADLSRAQNAAPPVGHAMARVRAERWNEVLTDYRLGWAENEREACLNNLGPLSGISRALSARAHGQAPEAAQTGAARGRAVVELADRLHAVHYFCPEGGIYEVERDGKTISCSVHGTALAPRQPTAPSEQSAAGRTIRTLSGMTATLTFMEDGLHAVVSVERK
jgi:hypothetical protein